MLDSIHTNTLTYRSHPNASRFAGTPDLHSNQCSLMHCQPTMAPARIEADDPAAAVAAGCAPLTPPPSPARRCDTIQRNILPCQTTTVYRVSSRTTTSRLHARTAYFLAPMYLCSRVYVCVSMCVRLCVRLCTRTHTHTLTICKCLAFCSCARAHKRRACVRVCVWGARTLPFPYMHMCVRACLPTGRKNAPQF